LLNSSGGYSGQLTFYDVMGRMSQRTNPAEMNGSWVPSGDDAAGWTSTYQTYDWNNRPLLATNPDGTTRESTYGGCGCAGGEQITTRDERGRRKRYTKDVVGRLVRVEELNWDQSVYATTNYTLNARDQLTTINQAGQTRTFAYDGHGRLQSRTTPEQGTTTYSYNADDMTQTITDARGATTTFTYNSRDLVTGITYGVPGGVAATPNVTFGYDSAGNRTSMTDGLGSVSYVYNSLSQMTSETRTFTGLGSYTLSYGYNLSGQLNSITNPWSVQAGYGYDKVGRITNVSGSGYAGVTSYVNSVAYRAFGVKQIAYNNGRTLSMQYDNRMRVTQWNIPNVMGWNYAYHYFNENTGRVVYAQNLNDPTLDRAWNYDHVGRPTHFTSGSNARHYTGQGGTVLNDGPYSHGYTFDVFGNRTYFEGWGGIGRGVVTETYTNNQRNGFSYDAAGNLTNDLGQTFTYDATGQQALASYGGYSLQQQYDGERLRLKKVENGTTTYYLRSTVLGGQIVAELNGTGTWMRGFVYLGDQLLAVQQNSQVSWVHQDPVAKSKRVTDGSGNVVSVVELDPWGGDTSRGSNEAFQPRRFNTYDRDGNASDEAMHRRYNRWHMRFDQPDPYDGSYDLTDPQSFNRYSYVKNDPVNFVDPTGLMAAICQWDYSMEFGLIGGVCFGGDRWGGFEPKPGGGGGGTPQPQPTPAKNCNFPVFDNLSEAQKALLDANTYNSLSDAQKANFLNQTGALNKAGINLGDARLQANGIHTDRLLFRAGTTDTFQASITTAISQRKFNRDKPIAREHPGMSDFGARQRKTLNALQAGFGPEGAFVDIDRSNPSNGLAGVIGHVVEVLTPGSTDPFAVGKALGRKVVGYDCK
jgi:RHS repeat-associated protein